MTTKTQETYGIVGDEEELRKFLAWLPDVKKGETIYVAVLARSKYSAEAGLPTFNSDRHQCSRFFTGKEDMIDRLYTREAPIGRYKCKGITVPQEAIAVYCSINHRSLTGGRAQLIARYADAMVGSDPRPNHEIATTHVHKHLAVRQFVDFDIDGRGIEEIVPLLVPMVDPRFVTIVQTRGGVHVLVESKKMPEPYKRTWYNDIKGIGGVDQTGDVLLPGPGCYQGNFIPRLYPMVELMEKMGLSK